MSPHVIDLNLGVSLDIRRVILFLNLQHARPAQLPGHVASSQARNQDSQLAWVMAIAPLDLLRQKREDWLDLRAQALVQAVDDDKLASVALKGRREQALGRVRVAEDAAAALLALVVAERDEVRVPGDDLAEEAAEDCQGCLMPGVVLFAVEVVSVKAGLFFAFFDEEGG